MKKKANVLFVLVFVIACGVSKQLTETDFSNFTNKIQNNKIEVSFEWANPLGLASVRGIDAFFINGSTSANINLIGNPNSFTISGDSLYVDLPYFGRHQNVAPLPGNNAGIDFKGIPKTATVEFDTKKQKAVLTYNFSTQNDSYNIMLTLFPGKKGYLNVTSDRKTAISYEGNWRVLKNVTDQKL